MSGYMGVQDSSKRKVFNKLVEMEKEIVIKMSKAAKGSVEEAQHYEEWNVCLYVLQNLGRSKRTLEDVKANVIEIIDSADDVKDKTDEEKQRTEFLLAAFKKVLQVFEEDEKGSGVLH